MTIDQQDQMEKLIHTIETIDPADQNDLAERTRRVRQWLDALTVMKPIQDRTSDVSQQERDQLDHMISITSHKLAHMEKLLANR